MKKMKEAIMQGLITIGFFYITTILTSFLFEKPELLINTRSYFLAYFAMFTIVKFLTLKEPK